MAKYIIWHDNAPICTGVMNDARTIEEWVSDKVRNITNDEYQAMEAGAWAELASIGEEFILDEYELKITISEWD